MKSVQQMVLHNMWGGPGLRRYSFLTGCFLLCSSYQHEVSASSSVTLTSTLVSGRMTYPEQAVTFTCAVTGSEILEWTSEHYIGPGGDSLQLLSIDGPGITASNTRNPSTIAECTAVETVGGVTRIESTLRIVVTPEFPISSVSCSGDGLGTNTTTFRTTNEPAQSLNCTLRQHIFSCPGDRLQFTCVTRDTEGLAWTSDSLIRQGGDRIDILSIDSVGTLLNVSGNTQLKVMLANVTGTRESETTVLTSTLTFVVPPPDLFGSNHSIICLNVDVGTQARIHFHIQDDCADLEATTEHQPTEFHATTATVMERSTYSNTNAVFSTSASDKCVVNVYVLLILLYTIMLTI